MTFDAKKILVIDDAPSIRTFLRISLQAHGAEFLEAPTARVGAELCQIQKPDLVVLDLGLPDRDGLELLPELAAQPQPPKVIILSVRKEQETKNKAFALGACDYMTKPFLMDDLIDCIEKHLL